jgi:hypothetical protein
MFRLAYAISLSLKISLNTMNSKIRIVIVALPIILASSWPMAAVIGRKSSPTRMTHPSKVARGISIPVSRCRMALCLKP